MEKELLDKQIDVWIEEVVEKDIRKNLQIYYKKL